MNTKVLLAAIAIVAALGTVAGVVGPVTLVTPAIAQNMTGGNMSAMGNMTGGNMSAGNMTMG